MSHTETVARMREVRAALEALADVEDLTDEQRADWDALNSEWDELDAARAAHEARAERIERVRGTTIVERETTADPSLTVTRINDENPNDLSTLRGAPGSRERATDLRDRVMRTLDRYSHLSDEQREVVERHADSPNVAEHIARYGSPEYRDAFLDLLANPTLGVAGLTPEAARLVSDIQRTALNEGTTTQGGFLVPPMLDPTIILTNNGTENPFRAISTIKSITTQTWKGVTSAGVTAEWLAEATEAADASPTVAQPTITPAKAAAWIQASFEVLEDTSVGAEVAGLLADARDRLESAAFAVGSGSNQPKGIVTALQAVTASRVAGTSGAAGAADFVVGDIYAVDNDLPPRHRPNATWVANKVVYNKIRRFGEGSTGSQSAFWVDLGGGRPPELIGYPCIQSSEMDSTIVSGSNDDILILGDFRKFYIVDRVGMSVAFEPLVKGSNRRPTGEVGWFAYWRVGSDTVDANAFRMLRV